MDAGDFEQLKEFLRNNLSIDIRVRDDNFIVKLMLEDEKISSDSIHISDLQEE